MNLPSESSDKNSLSRRQFLTAAGGITFAVAAGTLGFKHFIQGGNIGKNLPDQEITAWV